MQELLEVRWAHPLSGVGLGLSDVRTCRVRAASCDTLLESGSTPCPRQSDSSCYSEPGGRTLSAPWRSLVRMTFGR